MQWLYPLITIIIFVSTNNVLAETYNDNGDNSAQEEQQPRFKKLRYEELYSAPLSVGKNDNILDKIKYLPVNDDTYISIGGEARLRYEYTHNPNYGENSQDKRGVLFQRYTIHTDVHLNNNARFFLQLSSALEAGRSVGPSPVEENKLEFQNAFIDYTFDPNNANRTTLRTGRHEINLGSGRLVDVREGPNVRRTFDGVRLLHTGNKWDSTVFALRPRLSKPDVLDDQTDKEKTIWGIYNTFTYKALTTDRLDLYYIGYNNNRSTYEQGTGHEKRHSIGTRLAGTVNSWEYNWELVYQFGKFGNANINAWTIATETGYQWKSLALQPRLIISANIASGDKDPDNPALQSFNALFPRGNYFSEAAVVGPRNFFNFHPFLTVYPNEKWSFTSSINFFWRHELNDGLYGPSGQLLRAANGNTERYVGTSFSFNSEWSVNRNLTLTAIYSQWLPGDFIKATGSSEKIRFLELTMQFKF